MYESYFGFVNRPFIAAPSLERYFPAVAIEQTVQTATRVIARAEGPVAIFGGSGLGKTICCLRIAEQFKRSFDVVTLSSSALMTRRALLQSLLYELKLPYQGLSEGELRLSLVNRLQPSPDIATDGLLLMIDEAQVLPLKLLDEIRLLTNIQRNGLPRVRLVLCGNLKLEETLCNPNMDSLNQRLASRCYLMPLSREETARYVVHKIELCGVNHQRVITQDALEALYRGSDGIPRLIDQLADQTMLIAAQSRTCPVTANIVGKAWGMLQQLPNPWSEPEAYCATAIQNDENLDVSIEAESTLAEAIDREPTTRQSRIHIASQEHPAAPKTKTIPSSIIEYGDLEDSESDEGELEECESEYGVLESSHPEESDSEGSKLECSQLKYSVSEDCVPEEYELVENQGFFGEANPGHAPIATNSVNDFANRKHVRADAAQPSPSSHALHSGLQSHEGESEDLFGSNFDEEYEIPFQSQQSLKDLSGIAFGQLNYDLESFPAPAGLSKFDLEDEDEFVEIPAIPLQNSSAMEFNPSVFSADSGLAIHSTYGEEASLEEMVEEEMRELVSELNMSAMAFDPTQIIVELEPNEEVSDNSDLASQGASYLGRRSFVQMRDEWNEGNVLSEASRTIASDDRDMLVIEDDAETVTKPKQLPESNEHLAKPMLHPYAKLFSNLRKS